MNKYKSTKFFFSEMEQQKLLKHIEDENDIYYVKCGNFQNGEVIKFKTIGEMSTLISPNIGEHLYSSWIILPKYAEVFAQETKNGTSIYPLKGNEISIVYHPGGIFKGENLIHGDFQILSSNSEMMSIYEQIRKRIRQMSIKKGGYYIGMDTYEKRDKVKRWITISVSSPDDYDLKLN